jgi:hypothetical protein
MYVAHGINTPTVQASTPYLCVRVRVRVWVKVRVRFWIRIRVRIRFRDWVRVGA